MLHILSLTYVGKHTKNRDLGPYYSWYTKGAYDYEKFKTDNDKTWLRTNNGQEF